MKPGEAFSEKRSGLIDKTPKCLVIVTPFGFSTHLASQFGSLTLNFQDRDPSPSYTVDAHFAIMPGPGSRGKGKSKANKSKTPGAGSSSASKASDTDAVYLTEIDNAERWDTVVNILCVIFELPGAHPCQDFAWFIFFFKVFFT